MTHQIRNGIKSAALTVKVLPARDTVSGKQYNELIEHRLCCTGGSVLNSLAKPLYANWQSDLAKNEMSVDSTSTGGTNLISRADLVANGTVGRLKICGFSGFESQVRDQIYAGVDSREW